MSDGITRHERRHTGGSGDRGSVERFKKAGRNRELTLAQTDGAWLRTGNPQWSDFRNRAVALTEQNGLALLQRFEVAGKMSFRFVDVEDDHGCAQMVLSLVYYFKPAPPTWPSLSTSLPERTNHIYHLPCAIPQEFLDTLDAGDRTWIVGQQNQHLAVGARQSRQAPATNPLGRTRGNQP